MILNEGTQRSEFICLLNIEHRVLQNFISKRTELTVPQKISLVCSHVSSSRGACSVH